MRAVQDFPSASMLVKEIFFQNERLLSQGAEGVIREIANQAEEGNLSDERYSSYLHILKVFTFVNGYVPENQIEIILSLASRKDSNIRALCKDEGIKQLRSVVDAFNRS